MEDDKGKLGAGMNFLGSLISSAWPFQLSFLRSEFKSKQHDPSLR